MYINVNGNVNVNVHVHVHVHVHTYIHTYIHTCTTYIHIMAMAAAVWHLFVFLCFFANVRAKNNAKFNLLKIFNQSVSSAYFFGGTLNMQILIKMRHANIAKM